MRATELFVGGWNEEGDRLGRMRSDTRHGEEKVKEDNKEKCTRAHGFPKTSHQDRRPVLSAKKTWAMHECTKRKTILQIGIFDEWRTWSTAQICICLLRRTTLTTWGN